MNKKKTSRFRKVLSFFIRTLEFFPKCYAFQFFLQREWLIVQPLAGSFKISIGHCPTRWRKRWLTKSGRINTIIHKVTFDLGYFFQPD